MNWKEGSAKTFLYSLQSNKSFKDGFQDRQREKVTWQNILRLTVIIDLLSSKVIVGRRRLKKFSGCKRVRS